MEGAPTARAVDLQRFAERSFVAFTRHRSPAYFDQSIHLCSQAGFGPRIRYEASTVHGVLELVGAGLGIAGLDVAVRDRWCVLKGLQRPAPGEVLALLRRKVDANPMLPVLEAAVASIFDGLVRRLRTLIANAR